MTKDEIRKGMRVKRRMMNENEKKSFDFQISSQARVLLSQTEGIVAVYLAGEQEINLDDFILDALSVSRTVVAPRWNGETYELAKVTGLGESELQYGPMNIREPRERNIVAASDVSLWFVPGLAFTKDGMRIGYGGGWYDRLLSSASSESIKAGVAYPFQIVPSIPADDYDILLTKVLSVGNML